MLLLTSLAHGSPAVCIPALSSRRRPYKWLVHGSIRFGNRNARSPRAMEMVARSPGSSLCFSTVNSSCKNRVYATVGHEETLF